MAHVVVGVLISELSRFRRPIERPRIGESIEARIIIRSSGVDRVPVAEVRLRPIQIELDSIKAIQFEIPAADDVSGVIGPSSAPQLASFQIADLALFARQAGVTQGRPITVLLTIEVLPDGSVGRVRVCRSSGNAAADSAATDYAHLLRWTPGTVEHRPRAMQINFPVTLFRENQATTS